MIENYRYNCWFIDNIVFSGKDFSKTLEFNDEKIELLITNYQNSKTIEEPLKDWIHNKIINDGMMNSRNSPLPISSIFVITKNPYNHKVSSEFPHLLRLCLKIVYFQPTLISKTAEHVPNLVSTMVTWEGFKNSRNSSKIEINSNSFDKVIQYFNALKTIPRLNYFILEEIYRISQIDDSIIELLSLYSFIEGFWYNEKSNKSNITDSFISMLKTNYASGKENKYIRDQIIEKIKSQNSFLRNEKFDDMRHILAHGMYKKLENVWTSEQWNVLLEQRNLLFQIVFESLINKIVSDEKNNHT